MLRHWMKEKKRQMGFRMKAMTKPGCLKFPKRMVAFVGDWYRNPTLMQQALSMLSFKPDSGSNTPGMTDEDGNMVYNNVAETEYIRQIKEVEFANTNGISQWSSNYIEMA